MVLPHFVEAITQLQFNFFVSLPSEVTQVPILSRIYVR